MQMAEALTAIEEARLRHNLTVVETHAPKGYPLVAVLVSESFSAESPIGKFLSDALFDNDTIIVEMDASGKGYTVVVDDDFALTLAFSGVRFCKAGSGELSKKIEEQVLISLGAGHEPSKFYYLTQTETTEATPKKEELPDLIYVLIPDSNKTLSEELRGRNIPYRMMASTP